MNKLPHPLPLLVQEKVNFYRWYMHISLVNVEYCYSCRYCEETKCLRVSGTENLYENVYNWRAEKFSLESICYIYPKEWKYFHDRNKLSSLSLLPKNYFYSGISTEIYWYIPKN